VVDLTTEQILELKERFGSLEDAAVAALRDSPFAEEFKAILGTRLLALITSGRVPFHLPSKQDETLFWKLVWLTHDKPASRLQQRDPLPVREVTEAVRLRAAEGTSWEKIEESVRLSHRKIGYLRKALKHGDLVWDADHGCTTFGPEAQNTAAGIVLPVR
jgi:hypothetical protein